MNYGFVVLILFFVYVIPVYAATSVTVNQVLPVLDLSQEMSFNVQLTCTSCSSDSYLRAVFFSTGTNYFGFTQNKEGIWVNAAGAACAQYYKVSSNELIEGSWSGMLRVKVDTESSYYAGPGEYTFKVGRYTASCSSPTWSQEFTVAITGPTPTPTAEPTPTSTISPTYTPTTIVMSKTPTNTKIPTPSVSLGMSQDNALKTSISSEVLGVEREEEYTSSVSSFVKPVDHEIKVFSAAAAFIAAGLGLISGVLVWQKRHAMQEID